MGRELVATYGAKSDCGCSKPNQATISSVGLMNGISVVVAELLKNVVDTLEFCRCDEAANDSLESAAGSASASHSEHVALVKAQ